MEDPTRPRPAKLPARCALLAVGILAMVAGACESPPPDYQPILLPASSPRLLHDEREVREYLNAFPLDQYKRYRVRGLGSFFIDDVNDIIKSTIVDGGKWEKHVFKLLEKYVKPGDIVLDVGAHIGTHTMAMSRLAGPWGRVYAFEPQRKIYRELHHNLALNGANNVEAFRYAIGAGPARVVEMNPATPGNEGGTGVGSGGDKVELRSLDSFQFQRVSLIKIDVEGLESAVLEGAGNTIRRSHPVILLEIMGGHDYETASPEIREQIHATWRKLEELGYVVTPVLKHDYLALPRPRPSP